MADQQNSNPNKILQYTGLGFQMLAFIGIFIFIGVFIDKKIQMEKPWGVLVCSLLGSLGSIVYMIRMFEKIK